MKILFALTATLMLGLGSVTQAASLEAVVEGSQRSEHNRARDQYRHPVETLKFFGVEPDMTVVEIWPGAGWYTEILAPYLKPDGVFYAAHVSPAIEVPFLQKALANFEQKLADDPASYDQTRVVVFNPGAGELTVPDGSADRVLTFRNVHNWMTSDSEKTAFELFFKALKPGGVLGVVEHRAPPGTDRETMKTSGYVAEQYVIDLAQSVGFELDGTSEINANAADAKNHPSGVWTLPPSLRLGDQDRDKYLAIGESDRMTLRFRKPAQ